MHVIKFSAVALLLVMASIFVAAATLDYVFVNSTSITNDSSGTLIANTNLGTSLPLMFDWHLNGTSLTKLYLAIEAGSNTTGTRNYADFSTVNVHNAVYSAGGGYNGFGSYLLTTSDYINTSLPVSLGDSFTISLWMRPSESDDLDPRTLFDTDKGYIYLRKNGLNVVNFAVTTTTGLKSLDTPLGTLKTNQWVHIAAVYDGSGLSIYLNGTLNATLPATGTLLSSSDAYIGRSKDFTHYFNGTIDEILFIDRAYSADQIMSLFLYGTAKIVPSEINVVENWSAIGYSNDLTTDLGPTVSNNFTVKDFSDVYPPTIIVNSPVDHINVSSLSGLLNFSSNETGSLWYNFGSGNISICDSCLTGTANLSFTSYGSQSIILYANDSEGNLAVNGFSFNVFQDTDLDGLNDTIDFDDDGDGINDTDDFLTGNLTNIAGNIATLSLSVGGSTNLSQAFAGIQLVNFSSGGNSTMEVNFNFSSGEHFDLASLIMEKQNSSDTVGKLFVRGLPVLNNSNNKSIYINRLNTSQSSVCVKDLELESSANITSDCTGNNEIVVACPGVNGTYSCTISGDQYKIEGLSHSLVLETFDLPDLGSGESGGGDTGSSSSGGSGGGSSTTPATTTQIPEVTCETTWDCTDWSSCVKNYSSRTCLLKDDTCFGGEEPITTRLCGSDILFIELELDSYIIRSSYDLIALFDFKGFTDYVNVDLSLIIYDRDGLIHYDSPVDSSLEKVSFKDLELDSGFYDIILRANYDGEVEEYSQSFLVSEDSAKSLFTQDYITLGVFVAMVFIWLITLYGRFEDGL